MIKNKHTRMPSRGGWVAVAAMAAAAVLPSSLMAQFAGGTGTPADPYKVSTIEQLNEVRNHLKSSFVLTQDLDFAGSAYLAGEGWAPIGKTAAKFEGSFDGKGYTISGLFINRPAEDSVGLFGSVDSLASLTGITLDAATVTGRISVGALAGAVYKAPITRCSVNAKVQSANPTYNTGSNAGGMVGISNQSEVLHCSASGSVKSTGAGGHCVGGLIGWALWSHVAYCSSSVYASGVYNNHCIGSLIGMTQWGGEITTPQKYAKVEFCYATGNVDDANGSYGCNYAGGLIGSTGTYDSVVSCYATGDVKGRASVGGLIGKHSGVVVKSYSTGKVSRQYSPYGGLLGNNYTYNNVVPQNSGCYWNTQTSGLTTSAGGTGLSTAQMKDQANFAGWDFNNVWTTDAQFNNGYPVLQWMVGKRKTGMAMKFDGLGDKVVIPYSAAINPDVFTVSAWVLPEKNTGAYQLVYMSRNDSLYANRTLCHGFNIYINPAGNWNFWIGRGNATPGQNAWSELILSAVEYGKWAHIAATYDGTTMKFYINGTLAGSKASTFEPNKSEKASIGAFRIGTGVPYAGTMDDLSIWNKALSVEEVKAAMLVSNTNCKENLVMNMDFDRMAGITVDDKTGSHHGILSNNEGDEWVASTKTYSVGAPKDGQSLAFDGVNDYVITNKDQSLNIAADNNAYCVETWAKFNQLTSNQFMFELSDGVNPVKWMYFAAPSSIVIGYRDASNTFRDYSIPVVISTNTWYHFAVSYTGSAIELYQNGKLVSSSPTTTKPLNTLVYANIGCRFTKNYTMSGELDEMRFYNTARTQEQINTTMYTKLTGTEDGLVAYYDMDFENGNVLVDKAGANHGVLTNMTGTTEWVASTKPYIGAAKEGMALAFDGTNDKVEIPYSQALNPATFTVGAWVKPTGTSADYQVVFMSRDNDAKKGFDIGVAPGGYWYATVADEAFNTAKGSSVTLNTWQYLVASYDGTTLRLYVDGTLKTELKAGYIVNETVASCIGATNTGILNFKGSIDEISLFNTALSQEQIRTNMYTKLTGTEERLVAYYDMDNASGTILDDKVGYNNGVLTNMTGTTEWVAANRPVLGTAKEGMALAFNGTTQYVQTNNAVIPAGGNNYTVECWFYTPDQVSGARELVSQWTSVNSGKSFFLGTTAYDNIRFSDSWNNVEIGAWSIGQWHHLAAVSTTDNAYIYLDGVLKATKGSPLTYPGVGPLVLGSQAQFNNEFWKGQMDEVRIWNTARDINQIRNTMYTKLTGTEEGLEAYYDMDFANGTVLVDKKNFNNGAMMNMTGTTEWVAANLPVLGTAKDSMALAFDGANDYVTTPVVLNGSYTKTAWVKRTAGATHYNIISGTNTALWASSTNGYKLSAGHITGNWQQVIDTEPLPLDVWNYVAVTYDAASTTMKLYRNGKLVSTNTSVQTMSNEMVLLGCYNKLTDNVFKGSMDDVTLWGTALSEQDVRSLMYAAPEQGTEGLLAYYDMDFASGNVLVDKANYLNGTLTNMSDASWVEANRQVAVLGAAKDDMALNFDGANDYVVSQVSSDFNLSQKNNAYSFELWAKPEVTENKSIWFVELGTSAMANIYLWWTNNNQYDFGYNNFVFGYKSEAGTMVDMLYNYAITPNEWMHVAGVYNGTSLELFVNGVSLGAKPVTSKPLQQSASIYLGRQSSDFATSKLFDGQMDEVRVWNTARSIDQIRASMYTELTGKEEGLVAYYDMDFASGNILVDKANYLNGTLTNMSDESWVESNITLPGTRLSEQFRGTTVPHLATVLACNEVVGAHYYTWVFRDTLTKQTYKTYSDSASVTVIPGKLGMPHAATFSVEVRAVVGEQLSETSFIDTISSPAAPLTRLGAHQHNLKMLTQCDTIVCHKVTGATLYLYQFVDEKDNTKRFRHYNKGNSLRVCDVPGIEPGRSYQVTVLPRFYNSLSQFSVGARIYTPKAK